MNVQRRGVGEAAAAVVRRGDRVEVGEGRVRAAEAVGRAAPVADPTCPPAAAGNSSAAGAAGEMAAGKPQKANKPASRRSF